MGALVQVLAGDSVMVGTAFTDLHGRYLIAHLLPGKYDVKAASAALFVPARARKPATPLRSAELSSTSHPEYPLRA